MKAQTIKIENGDTADIRIPDEGGYICPICGSKWPGEFPYVEVGDGSGHWLGTHNICLECGLQYGHSDMVAADSPVGRLHAVWEDLRLKWLDRVGWSEEHLKRLRDNLEIDTESLKKRAKR